MPARYKMICIDTCYQKQVKEAAEKYYDKMHQQTEIYGYKEKRHVAHCKAVSNSLYATLRYSTLLYATLRYSNSL